MRKPRSLERTWCLLLASMALYFPANLLPIMAVGGLGGTSYDTIMSGVINFWRKGGFAPGGEDYRWAILRERMPPWATPSGRSRPQLTPV